MLFCTAKHERLYWKTTGNGLHFVQFRLKMNKYTGYNTAVSAIFAVEITTKNPQKIMMRKRLFSFILVAVASLTLAVAQQKAPVFLYAGQSNADGREYTTNLPDYMKQGGALPSSPYTHLKWASICGNPSKTVFDTRVFNSGERYAFCDVTNYWIDKAVSTEFYAIKCAYGGTAIAPGVTAEKLPIWYADAEWMQTHNAYKGDDITKAEYANNNSLTKNLTEGFASLVDGTLAALDNGYDVKAILWHQGESDRNAAGSYYTNFKTMIAYMRQAIYAKTGDEQDLTLPFIFGTVCRRSTQYNATVEAAQKQVAAEDDNVYYIDMKNATLLSDNLHFDKQATEYLGKKMYNLLAELGLVSGEQVEVEEFPVKESVMDGVEVPSPDNRSWDFTSFSQETKDALAADVALTTGAKWNYNSGWGYRRGNGMDEEQLTADSVIISETDGLYFSGAQSNRVTLNTGSGYLGFVDGSPMVYVPKLTAGQLIYVTARGNKTSVKIKPGLDMDDLIEAVGETEVGTSDATVCFRVKYNVTLPTHIAISTSGPAFIKKIWVKTPETVNILIGADRIETFASDQPLDFSPFTDLFKAYVVTGYDDGTGVIDMEQVLQVPANTGVVLMGEESTVNAPVIEGDAPVLTQDNLLTAVVGSGSAPANSYVLTTSQGVTQFTKTATIANLQNQAYLPTLGSLDAYDFFPMEAKTEHIFDIAGGSILAKGTKLTFTDVEHHSVTDGTSSIKVYGPANATTLDGRFAFDNSGNWAMDGNNYRLGANSGRTLYCSVVSLVNGDRVKFEVSGNDASKVTLTALNGVLRGVSAGSAITPGTTYTVVVAANQTVNLDLKMYCGTNRAGFTKMTVWSSTETTPIYAVTTPTANVTLQQVREGLFKPVATLAATAGDAAITYYYKGGDAADWTAIDGSAFEPTQKAVYQLKATASGYADSEPLTLSLGARYALTKTVADLTDEALFTASTKDESGFDWATANNVKITGLPANQVFGHLNAYNAITGLAVQNNNLDARYSFAKGIGLANNYGYYVTTTSATAYDFAEYEVYQPNAAITEPTQKVLVYNPSSTQYKFSPLKAVRLYEPVEMTSVTIADIGYATFSSESALDFTGSGVEAYYATVDGDAVSFTNAITNPAANTGLLLKAPEGTYEVMVVSEGEDVSSENKLVACAEAKTVGITAGCDYGKVFILSKHNEQVGFFKSDNGRTLQAGKSFLYLENPSDARLVYGFPFNEQATGICLSTITLPKSEEHVYNLNGQRLRTPAKGLNIIRSANGHLHGKNGKKIIVK